MIYEKFIETKTGSLIPLLKSGKTCESKYNPEAEAEKKLSTLDFSEKIFLILGLGSGIFISELIKRYPDLRILVCENSIEDIDFLSQLPCIKALLNTPSVYIFPQNELTDKIVSLYIPSLHGNLKIIETPNWLNEINENQISIKKQIDHALREISADYSVQAHFGKIWQANILKNLSRTENKLEYHIPLDKTALILAAGPSLDEKYSFIKENRDRYYIISTDTAYLSACNNGIISDVVISLDGQIVSANHFSKSISDKTLYVMDLCSSASAVRKIIKHNGNVLFFSSGHPLSEAACSFSEKSIIKLYSGSGTVTISALDFAIKTGFSKIEIMGADFSYLNGKPYTKGTYLDVLYQKDQIKTHTAEELFNKLIYRTEIKKRDGKIETEILSRYRESLLSYLKKNNCTFYLDNYIYYIKTETSSKDFFHLTKTSFDFSGFINAVSKDNNNISLWLPYISFLRNRNKEANFNLLLKKAKNMITFFYR